MQLAPLEGSGVQGSFFPPITCKSIGAPGGPGHDGIKGNKGPKGRAGGNTGKFLLTASLAPNFTYAIYPTVGEPGTPGPGSEGQAGGPPGPSGPPLGHPADIFTCVGPAGKISGNPGPHGDSGDSGEAGHIENYCVRTQSPPVNDCTN